MTRQATAVVEELVADVLLAYLAEMTRKRTLTWLVVALI
jgi:hypothetical protein